MLTPKENFYALLRSGRAPELVNQYEPFAFVNYPLRQRDQCPPGGEIRDSWGVTIRWPEGDPGDTPISTPRTKVCQDVTQWRRFVRAPLLDLPDSMWEQAVREARSVDRSRYFVTCAVSCGLFERLHYLMGFEDTLVNFLLEPEAMHELLDFLTAWRIEYLRQVIQKLNPDFILFHDDWGAKDRLFMSPEVWREFFKARYQRIYGFAHEHGVRVIHHADSFLMPIAGDLADLGIDVWQGVLPENDIPTLQKILAGKVLLMGGIDVSAVDTECWTRERIKKEVERVCENYVPGGWYIPCMTYGSVGSVFPGVYEAISEEIQLQGNTNSMKN